MAVSNAVFSLDQLAEEGYTGPVPLLTSGRGSRRAQRLLRGDRAAGGRAGAFGVQAGRLQPEALVGPGPGDPRGGAGPRGDGAGAGHRAVGDGVLVQGAAQHEVHPVAPGRELLADGAAHQLDGVDSAGADILGERLPAPDTRALTRRGWTTTTGPSTRRAPFSRGLAPDQVDESRAIDVEMSPGEVVFFSEATLHGSNANVSDVPRVAYSLRFTTPEVRFDL